MSPRDIVGAVGAAVGGVLGWSADPPPADPDTLRALFADLGVRPGPTAGDLDTTVRAFQAWIGLTVDGVAGSRTVHALVRYAREARHLRTLAACRHPAMPRLARSAARSNAYPTIHCGRNRYSRMSSPQPSGDPP